MVAPVPVNMFMFQPEEGRKREEHTIHLRTLYTNLTHSFHWNPADQNSVTWPDLFERRLWSAAFYPDVFSLLGCWRFSSTLLTSTYLIPGASTCMLLPRDVASWGIMLPSCLSCYGNCEVMAYLGDDLGLSPWKHSSFVNCSKAWQKTFSVLTLQWKVGKSPSDSSFH